MTIDVARSVKKMFVDGKWVESESGQLFDADSPATGEIIAQVPKGTRADAQHAVEAAHRARKDMARLKGFERSRRLHRIAEADCTLLLIHDADADDAIRYYASLILSFQRRAWVFSRGGDLEGLEVDAAVVKNRLAPPGRTERWVVPYPHGKSRDPDIP